jgi:hypothetical protein
MPSGANCLPDGDFFAFGEYDWGLLQLIYAVIWENKGTVTMNSFNTIQKTWVRTEGVEGAIADFVCFHCPLVASAEAKPLPLMAQSTPPQSHSR